MARELLPVELCRTLWDYHDPARQPREPAPTLLLIADEPWLPWELLRLQEPAKTGRSGSVCWVEIFALTRWLPDSRLALALPRQCVGLVLPRDAKLTHTGGERAIAHNPEPVDKPRIADITAHYNGLIEKLDSRSQDGWHLAYQTLMAEESPDIGHLGLNPREQLLPLDLERCDIRDKRPLVFLNAGHSARADSNLTGFGGLAQALISAGAGAVIGTRWALVDEQATAFAIAFFEYFVIRRRPLGEASRQARLWLRNRYPEDPTWLAYAVFAHPQASVSGIEL